MWLLALSEWKRMSRKFLGAGVVGDPAKGEHLVAATVHVVEERGELRLLDLGR